jgi:hypothetical protein
VSPCFKKGCASKLARWKPVLNVWPKGLNENSSPPAKIEIEILLCEECMKATTPDDLMTDEGWNMLKASFYKLGYTQPERDKMMLTWKSKSINVFGVLP